MTTASLPARRATRLGLMTLGWAVLIGFLLIEIMPFFFAAANSFKCRPAAQSNPRSIIPVLPFGVECQTEEGHRLEANETSTEMTFNPTLEGYQRIIESDLPQWVFNTVFISVSLTIFRLIIDTLAGYALARLKFPGHRVFFFVVLSTMMMPPIILVIPRFIILKEMSMLNTYQGLILPLTADAFGIFMIKQFFETFSRDIEEAARVDGATRFDVFVRIVLPVSTPALTALAIFSFQMTWNDFLNPLIILSGNNRLWTLPVGLIFWRGMYGEGYEWPPFLAGAILTTLPLALIFLYSQRYFVENVGYTGLKG
jgi:multiple sugar transport system permease protein